MRIINRNNYRGAASANVHRSVIHPATKLDGLPRAGQIIQSFDFIEGESGSLNAGFQHRVEDNVGILTDDNDFAVREGERARMSRESGFAQLDRLVADIQRRRIASSVPRFEAFENDYGEIVGAVSIRTNLRTGFDEIELRTFDDHGGLKDVVVYENTRGV